MFIWTEESLVFVVIGKISSKPYGYVHILPTPPRHTFKLTEVLED
jgi:hypothetical protein